MIKNIKMKYLLLCFVFFFVLFLQTIVYSAINSTMIVKGDAFARSDADIRITDFKLASTNNATLLFTEFGKTHVVSEVNFISSSSTITYYVEITNYGSDDMGIYSITGLPSGISYSISNYILHDKLCDDSGKCNSYAVKTLEITLSSDGSYSGNIQMNFEFRSFHNVIYNDVNNLGYPTYVINGGTLSVNFKEALKRILIYKDGVKVNYYKNITSGQNITFSNVESDIEFRFNEYVAKVVNGSLDEIGSEVCIDDQCFHIINNDGSTVSMVSKYNLYVGGTLDENGSKYTAYGDEATGLQDPKMRGYYAAGKVRHGVVQFAAKEYWSSSVSKYPSYVYGSNSNLYSYAENYKNYLIGLGVEINNIRLLDTTDLSKLGCSVSAGKCSNTDYNFIYYTTFWTGDASDSSRMLRVVSDGRYNALSATGKSGLRPVIEVPIDEIRPLVSIKAGNYDTVGSEICISDDCFYVIGSDDTNVTMLSKYNLYVGYQCTSNDNLSCTEYGEEATGKQDSTMLGFSSATTTRNGTTNFSSESQKGENFTDYSGSIAEIYVNNYGDYISDFCPLVGSARLISYSDLINLGCSYNDRTCVNAPRWVYSTSYWTSTGSATTELNLLWRVQSDGSFTTRGYSIKYTYGIRPVITISKDIF